MGTEYITVLIYQEDAKLIHQWTLQYPDIETGGDLFGLWQNESEVVVQLAIGPGENCRRTPTAFFQDVPYLENVGSFLASTEGLCNIGEWHSHHSLNLPEPSHGDKQTIWRNLPTCKLNRFLLFIATISRETGCSEIHSFMFTSPENRHGEKMFRTRYKILPGPNPFRVQREIEKTLSQGAEVVHAGVKYEWTNKTENIKESEKEKEEISEIAQQNLSPKNNIKESKKEKEKEEKKRENEEKKKRKEEKKKKEKEEKKRTNEDKKMRKEEEKRKEKEEKERENEDKKMRKEEEKAKKNDAKVMKKKKNMMPSIAKRSSDRSLLIRENDGIHESSDMDHARERKRYNSYDKSSVETKPQESSSVSTSDRNRQQQQRFYYVNNRVVQPNTANTTSRKSYV